MSTEPGTSVSGELFAGVPVSDYAASLPWYERLLGGSPAFNPTATEAVWELAANRYLYIIEDPARAGRALQTVIVADLTALLAALAARDLTPTTIETYEGGMRKALFHDADGNEIAFGGQG